MENIERPCIFILGGAKTPDAFMMITSVLKDKIADKVLAKSYLEILSNNYWY